ncbi:PEP/pyruvate-binding domain-containing protein [Microbacterium sp. SS28]|uniref:PEP/pyruvate-binding domain-containing protein n=1 Tax=Microbacterium sp. SS28 TaxID=2919948 RepID=UPI001FAA627F|nr:PEP/pyruvate-binding domain-containing protein [Microbacterium sp. SS28]
MTGFLPRALPAAPTRIAGLLPPQRISFADLAEALATLPLAVDEIDTLDTFQTISTLAGDLVANGRVAKFLIDRRDPTSPAVRFVNGNFLENGQVPDAARYHYFFGRATFGIAETLDAFNALTYFTADKRYIAGSIRTYFLEGAADPVFGLQFYPQDVIRERLVVEAVSIVRARIGIPSSRFAFVPTGAQQTTDTVGPDLAGLEVEVLPLDRILGAIDYVPLNVGEAWGHLRIFPEDRDALTATDIPVFDELPLDLSVVAGVITKAVQDTNSHVNLKSKERDTPNAVLRSAALDHPRLAPFADKPVHFVVRKDGFDLEESTDEIVAAKLAERLDRPLVQLVWDAETEVRSYDELATGTTTQTRAFAARYGSKAANLGFLAHRDVLGRVGETGSPSAERGYDLVPKGLAVPLQAYRDFIEHPPNSDVRALIDLFVADEQAGALSPKQRAARVDEIQSGIMAASFPPGALERVRAKLNEVLPGVEKVKVRSSANAEDVPDFDGAGLHDSFAADTTKRDRPIGPCLVEEDGEDGEVKRKVKPKSLGCAMKGVYASLWNKRAVEERSFARIDQTTIAMGLAIVPAYDAESDVTANAVVVTRVLNTEHVFGYSLSVQAGNNLVTNPDPGTWSELTVAAFIADDEPASLTTTRYAKPTRDADVRAAPVLAGDRMLELVDLARRVERAYCRATRGYYRDCRFVTSAADKESSLDLELKIFADGRLVYKQVREFGGR